MGPGLHRSTTLYAIRFVFPNHRTAPPSLAESDIICDLPAAPPDVPEHTSAYRSTTNQGLRVRSTRLFPTRPHVQEGSGLENDRTAVHGASSKVLPRLSYCLRQMYSKIGWSSDPSERLLRALLLISLYSTRSERAFCQERDVID